MRVQYKGEHEVEVPALDRIVAPGETIEVSDVDAEGLVHQSVWHKVKEAKKATDASKDKKEADE